MTPFIALVTSLLSSTAQLQCQEDIFQATIVSKSLVVVPADAIRSKNCKLIAPAVKNKMDWKGELVLKTSFLSFDIAFLTLNQGHSKPVKISTSNLKIGEDVFSLHSITKRSKPAILRSATSSCEEATSGAKRALSLPKEEAETHPDQTYGYKLWKTYCELASGIKVPFQPHEQASPVQGHAITLGKVLWSDDINLILQGDFTKVTNGAPLFRKSTGEFVGFVTSSRVAPEKDQKSLGTKAQLAHVFSANTYEKVKDAVKLGLWDY